MFISSSYENSSLKAGSHFRVFGYPKYIARDLINAVITFLFPIIKFDEILNYILLLSSMVGDQKREELVGQLKDRL